MLKRTATFIVPLGAIGVAVALGASTLLGIDTAPPAGFTSARCRGWVAVRMPELQLVDVAATSADDVWLLTERGVYHFDGCTWRAHAPFDELVGRMMAWESIVVDPDGAHVVTGVSGPGPSVASGCEIGPASPPQRRSYRFVRGASRWSEVDARPRAKRDIEVAAPEDARTRGAVADGDLPDQLRVVAKSGAFAIVQRERHVSTRDASGHVLGWGTVTSTELWQHRGGAWSVVLGAPPPAIAAPRSPSAVEALGDMHVEAIGGSGPDDRWAVGYRADVMPEIMHFDGTTWTSHRGRFRRDLQYRLLAVASTSPRDVWVVGSSGTVLHFDGVIWRDLEPPTFYDLVEVITEPGRVRVRDAAGGELVLTRTADLALRHRR